MLVQIPTHCFSGYLRALISLVTHNLCITKRLVALFSFLQSSSRLISAKCYIQFPLFGYQGLVRHLMRFIYVLSPMDMLEYRHNLFGQIDIHLEVYSKRFLSKAVITSLYNGFTREFILAYQVILERLKCKHRVEVRMKHNKDKQAVFFRI